MPELGFAHVALVVPAGERPSKVWYIRFLTLISILVLIINGYFLLFDDIKKYKYTIYSTTIITVELLMFTIVLQTFRTNNVIMLKALFCAIAIPIQIVGCSNDPIGNYTYLSISLIVVEAILLSWSTLICTY